MKEYTYRKSIECNFCNKKVDEDIKVNMLNDPVWIERQCCKDCMEDNKNSVRGVTISG